MPREQLTLAQTQDVLSSLIVGRPMGPGLADPAELIDGDRRASAAERVAVYAFMYRARLVEALESQFPRLAKRVGGEVFGELASAYVQEHPSTHPSLRPLGATFADWLARRPSEPALADLAKLEWARADIFDAMDERVLDLETVRAWPRERFAELPIKLIGAHRRLVLARGTVTTWQRIGDGESVDEIVVPASDTESVVVWRQGVAVFHRAIGEAEHEALALAAAGTTLGRICECAGAWGNIAFQEAVSQAFAWLWSWVNDQLLARA